MKQTIKRLIRLLFSLVYILAKPFLRCGALPSCPDAEKTLDSHSPDPGSSPLCDGSFPEAKWDLAVIIPVYNVQAYLAECLDSVLSQQTDYRFRVIAVNDGSTDNSAAVLKSYAADPRLTILEQPNKGLAGARNTGLAIADAEYLMFLDSDDILPPAAVQHMLDIARKEGADLVQGSYVSFESGTGAVLEKKIYPDAAGLPRYGALEGYACMKLLRRTLFEGVCFPEGYLFEDTILTSLVIPRAKAIASTSRIIYRYRVNTAGISATAVGKPRSIDTFRITRKVTACRPSLGLEPEQGYYEELLRQLCLNYQRTAREPEAVKKSIFTLTGALLAQEKNGREYPLSRWYRELEQAVLTGNYRRYALLCRIPMLLN